MALNGPLKTKVAHAWRLLQMVAGPRERLTILYYHAVSDGMAAKFRRQMEILAEEAEVVFADTRSPCTGSKPLVAVTFDDAFQSVRENALPVIETLGLPIMIFVPTGRLGESPRWDMETDHDRNETVMSEQQLAKILSPNVRLAAHSVDHPRMSQISQVDRMRQFATSRLDVERITRAPVESFAFPYGDYNKACLTDAKAAGYKHVYSVQPQMIDPTDPSLLRGRTSCDPADNEALFRLKFQGAFAWMPYATKAKVALLSRGR